MRTLLGITLLAACPGIAADQDFNGRWDLTALTQPRPRAWWHLALLRAAEGNGNHNDTNDPRTHAPSYRGWRWMMNRLGDRILGDARRKRSSTGTSTGKGTGL